MQTILLRELLAYHETMGVQLREAAVRAKMRAGCGLHFSADRHLAWAEMIRGVISGESSGQVTIGLMKDGRWSVEMNGARAIARKGVATFDAEGNLALDTDHGDGPQDAAKYPKVGEPLVPFRSENEERKEKS